MHPTSSHPRRRSRGATLVESMAAITIIAISSAGFASSLIASSRQNAINDGRAAAQLVANELAELLTQKDFTDPLLSLPGSPYSGDAFAAPKVLTYSVTGKTATTPAFVVETFNSTPNHNESELTGYVGRDIATTNMQSPGDTLVFRRYWNVREDPNNRHLKIIAVHVTYQRTATQRGVASTFIAKNNQVYLTEMLVQ